MGAISMQRIEIASKINTGGNASYYIIHIFYNSGSPRL